MMMVRHGSDPKGFFLAIVILGLTNVPNIGIVESNDIESRYICV